MKTKSKETYYSEHAKHWLLEKQIIYLNHGAFGACPKPVLEKQQDYREMLERYPIRFMIKELGGLLHKSKQALADFIGVANTDLAFVPNATHGVNTVLKSLKFNPGDEILITNFIYPACRNVVNFIAKQFGVKIVEVLFEKPVSGGQEILDAIVSKVTPKTRLALIDHITFQTALILPVKEIVAALQEKGVDTLVDGAHAPGAISVQIADSGAAYYTGNCHKWLCAPKGAGFLYVREDKQQDIHPLSISHVAGDGISFDERFFWTGTYDPSPMLCVGEALRFMATLYPAGWPELMQRNRNLVLTARKMISQSAGLELFGPDEMIGSMASFRIPHGQNTKQLLWYEIDPLQEKLNQDYSIEVPVMYWPQPPNRVVRISVQAYNTLEQYKILAEALRKLLAADI